MSCRDASVSVPDDLAPRGAARARLGHALRRAARLWRSAWRSVLPYTLAFDFEIVQDERPHLLAGRASGELTGSGVWRLYEGELGTASTWEWTVATTVPWMNAFGPVARPAFAWNHHRIMRQGAEGIARELGCALVAGELDDARRSY